MVVILGSLEKEKKPMIVNNKKATRKNCCLFIYSIQYFSTIFMNEIKSLCLHYVNKNYNTFANEYNKNTPRRRTWL